MTSPRTTRRRSARWLAGGALAAVLAGCAGDSTDATDPGSAPRTPAPEEDATVEQPDEPAGDAPVDEEPADRAGDDAAEVAIRDDDGFVFAPTEITVAAGDAVTWVHEGRITHTVTAENGSFDSGDLAASDTFTETFDEAGSYPFFCRFHGSMRGTVTVE
ncbi:MAG: cupredoxin family copper-binding protein [Ilumatobacteraceae bacterium]